MTSFMAIHKTCLQSRGFSLIEAAIVLGIVGLVIGGIWAAASSVSTRNNINNTANAVDEAIYGLRLLYNDKPLPDGVADYTSVLIVRGVIKGNFVKSSTQAQNPWGGFFLVQTYLATSSPLRITLSAVPAAACVDLFKKIVGNVDANGIGKHGVYTTTIAGSIVAPNSSLATIGNRCSSASSVTMRFDYLFPDYT